jgi:hypothetical protein
MAETARLSGHSEWIDLDFVERERTPEPAMALVFSRILRDPHCRIPSSYSKLWVSNAAGKRSTSGYRKPIYSQNLADLRIKLRWMKQ